MNYLSVEGTTTHEIVISRSRFICTVQEIRGFSDAEIFIQKIKKQYSDATHNCYAFISNEVGTEQRFSDDGEPQGTAGQPMLEVLKKRKLNMTAVVVTRYFGGVKLGAGGLVSAYTRAVAETLDKAKIINNIYGSKLTIECGYEMYNVLINALKNKVYTTLTTSFADNVTARIAVPDDDVEDIVEYIKDSLLGHCTIDVGSSQYYKFNKV